MIQTRNLKFLTLLCIAILLQASCISSSAERVKERINEYISDYADAAIVISGLADEEFTVTPRELAGIESVSQSAQGGSAKAGVVKGSGPTLKAFLAEYGCAPEELTLARFTASDGYRVTLHEKTLTGGSVILALTGGSGALPESERPLRLIIPGEDSSRWIYAVERIEFVKK